MCTTNKSHRSSIVFVMLTFLMVSLLAGMASAKPKKKAKKKAPAPTAEEIQKEKEYQSFISDLQSTDPEKVVTAVQMLGANGNPEACGPLIELLKTGPGNDITDLTLQTLGVLGNPAAVDTLISYLDHRRPDARLMALFALEGFTSGKIKNALERKLRDSDPHVRASAALALASKGDASSVPVLYKAFNRGVNEAAVSIGMLGANADALRLTEYLGKLDISVLLPGFREFLVGARLDDATKLKLLNILFDFAGPEVRQFAVEMQAKIRSAHPEMEYDDPILKLLSKMISQIAHD